MNDFERVKDPERRNLPARNYSWESFREGNWVSLRHGAESPRIIDPLAKQIAEKILKERPHLEGFPFAVMAWARSEARLAILGVVLDQSIVANGQPDEKYLEQTRKEERRAAEERRNLGLDPSSWTRLQKEISEAAKSGFDLEKARAEGQKVRVAAEARFERERAEREQQNPPELSANGEEAADA